MSTQHQQKSKLQINPQPKYRNIIFDMGGVLVYWKPKEIIADLFKNEPEKPWHLIDAVHSREWLDLDRGTITTEQAFASVESRFHHKNLKQDLIKFWAAVPAYFAPIPEGIEILRAVQARGYNTYVLSNMMEQGYNRIATFDFVKTFQGCIYSYQVKAVKPDPDIYHILFNTYQLNPAECIFIDDMDVNIQGALAVGMDGIVCNDYKIVWDGLRERGIII